MSRAFQWLAGALFAIGIGLVGAMLLAEACGVLRK